MKNNLTFAVLDGDERYDVLRGMLPRVTESPSGADVVVFPVPFEWNDEIMQDLTPNQLIFAGYITSGSYRKAEALGLTLHDYCSGEPFTVANALSTAEGAVELAIRETKSTLASSSALVIGFGRIGKLLAHRLKPLCGSVSVYARSVSDRAWIKAYGYGMSDYLSDYSELIKYNIIFNTAPAMMLDAEALGSAGRALIIDLASKPGGTDFHSAERLGVRAIHALSLPGKTAPVTSAAIIRDAIMTVINENTA